MQENQRVNEPRLRAMERDFLSTLQTVGAAFGEYAFRRWQKDKQTWRKQVLAALYDAQMFACRKLDRVQVREKRNKILKGLKALFANDEFRRSIDSATNTPNYFRHRIGCVRNVVRQSLG